MKLSVVINVDTRPQNDTFGGNNLTGVCNEDFLVYGVENKRCFFRGFDVELIVHVDEHLRLPQSVYDYLHIASDTLIIRKHTNEPNFNDWSYIRALSAATGDIVIHFDQDTAAFSHSQNNVESFLGLLDQHGFVSYPSGWSPLPVHDNSFDHVWCSTRFFMCKRSDLDLAEISKCQKDYDYWCEKYPVARKCHWLEHLIGSIAKYKNQSVYYPPINTDGILIFSWDRYVGGTLGRLNEMNYDEIVAFVNECGGIHYPNDVTCK